MLLIISLVLAAIFVLLCGKAFKKHPNLFYIGAGIITAVLAVVPFDNAPDFVNNYILALFRRGSLATAIFIIVMYTGALKNGSPLMKKLIVIRGELSIMASIMILCHNIFFGKTYFVRLFTAASAMPVTQLLAAIASLLMLAIMIPLAIMSFPKIRKRMKPKLWKRLQRTAYAFYALIYIHIFLLTYASAQARRGDYAFSLIAYTIVFGVYLVMRVRKYILKKHINAKVMVNAGSGVCTAAIVGVVCLFIFISSGENAAPARASVKTFSYSTESSVNISEAESHHPVAENSETSQTSETTSAESSEESKDITVSKSSKSSTTSKTESKSVSSEASKSNTQSSQSTSPNSNNTASNSSSSNGSSSNNIANQNKNTTNNTTNSRPSVSKPSPSVSSKPSSNTPNNNNNTVSKVETTSREQSKEPVIQNKYKNGRFSGSAYGYDGNIYVNITIDDDKITNIEAVSDESDPWYFESCVQNVTSQIISSQDTNVDATSGATYSSEGIMAAVEQALNSAKN